MKIKKISEHVWSLKTWFIIPIHVWLVKDEDGVTLIDAGMAVMAKGILRNIERLQVGPLQRIILTHGHSDHVGAITSILNVKKVPVYAHHIEIPYINGELPYPGRKKAVEVLDKRITQPLSEDAQGNQQMIAGLIPYLTPGHSPGHVAYYHEKDQILLAGDLFTTKKGKLNRPMPMFTADMQEAIKSSEILRQLKPKQLEVCHGEPIVNPANQLDEYLRKNNGVMLN